MPRFVEYVFLFCVRMLRPLGFFCLLSKSSDSVTLRSLFPRMPLGRPALVDSRPLLMSSRTRRKLVSMSFGGLRFSRLFVVRAVACVSRRLLRPLRVLLGRMWNAHAGVCVDPRRCSPALICLHNEPRLVGVEVVQHTESSRVPLVAAVAVDVPRGCSVIFPVALRALPCGQVVAQRVTKSLGIR